VGSGVVALVGVGPDGKKAGIAVAVTKEYVERRVSAAEIAAKAAKALGGGTAKSADVVSGGGPNVDAVDEALALARRQAPEAVAGAPR
jgi:alanyl-tRNA synthetase